MNKLTVALIMLLFTVFMLTGSVGSSSVIYKGMASWYSEDDEGILVTTANMERFYDQAWTCAIWDMPFNTILKVTNVDNGKYMYVRVNDRGPAKRLVAEGRIIDLTKAGFSIIGDLEDGLIRVKIEVL